MEEKLVMIEPLVSAIGVIVTTGVGYFIGAVIAESSDDMLFWVFIATGAALLVDCLFAIYFLVRFIHWCWLTPIPLSA
ncbi:MAG TPA: hypothetical protein VMB85_14600 [Bryobacteraceae bacterium]|nr:hypothetical protein [Bryobacteraceae bacterium]